MNKETIASLIVGAIGLIGIGYGIGQCKKLNDISEKLDKSISELSSDMNVDISEDLVASAIDKAVEREVSAAVSRATAEVAKSLKSDISSKVRDAVNISSDKISTDVEKEIRRQVQGIDIEKLKKDVVRQAKQDAADKLETSLNDILEGFNSNLKNLSTVYSSMAQTMSNAANSNKVGITLG